MTGSLQTKSGTYYAVVRIPDDTGREKQKWISTGIPVAGNNKRQAHVRLREIISEMEQRKVTYSADILFLSWVDKWLEQKQNEVRLNTYESYEWAYKKYIVPFFAPLKLTLGTIAPQHIQDFYNRARKNGQSATSVRKHNVIIRGALQDAMKKNMIPYNPADRATLPKKKKFIGSAYSVAQANALLKVIDGEPIKPAIILGLFYGLRRSEVLGLRWGDIDFQAGTIHIRNTVVKTKTRVEAEQTKSQASTRTLFIIPETRNYLMGVSADRPRTAC